MTIENKSELINTLKSLETKEGVITIPFDIFYNKPNEKLVLNVKNKSPDTSPYVIKITKISCEFNYVDAFGSPTETVEKDFFPNTLPGNIASITAEKGKCVRTFSYQITVGIPELDEYLELEKRTMPDLDGCLLEVNTAVGPANDKSKLDTEIKELADKLFDGIFHDSSKGKPCTVLVDNNLPSDLNSYIFGQCAFIFSDGSDEVIVKRDVEIYSGQTLTFKSTRDKCVEKFLLRIIIIIGSKSHTIDKLFKAPPGKCLLHEEIALEANKTVSSDDFKSKKDVDFFRLIM